MRIVKNVKKLFKGSQKACFFSFFFFKLTPGTEMTTAQQHAELHLEQPSKLQKPKEPYIHTEMCPINIVNTKKKDFDF